MTLDFRPPKENWFILRLSYGVLPLVMRRVRGIAAVSIPKPDWAHLETFRRRRAILSANHPTASDPLISMYLSRRLGEPFNYLACRELFHGPWGWIIQHVGAYSIHRGLPDRQALRMTRRLLVEMDRKVVIFPEGETYEQNDSLIPFQQGVIQIGFGAVEELRKGNRDPSMPVLPIAVKYRCTLDPRPAIDAGLNALEGALVLSPGSGQGFYQRLRRVGEQVLTRMEQEFRLKLQEGCSLEQRITAAKEHVLSRVAREVGVSRSPGAPISDQMRALFNAVYDFAGEFEDAPGEYGRRQHARRLMAARPLLADLRRLQNFLAVTDGYVAEQMTGERFLDVIGRLEREVFGRVHRRVPREAVVRIAPAVELGEHYEAYRQRRREVVAQVTADVEGCVRTLLRELAALGTVVE
jgi:1-acyl-sn-glycerol-3-phosphate acyltransferase